MDQPAGFDAMWRRTALRNAVLALAVLAPLLIIPAIDAPSAMGIVAVALLLGVLIAAGSSRLLATLVAVINRRMTRYRRRDGVVVESNDPPLHPVRPRAPGLA